MAERVTVRWLLAVLIALPLFGVVLPWALQPGPDPRPTLVGVPATAAGVDAPILLGGRTVARTRVPDAEAAARLPLALDLRGSLVWAIPVTPGVDVAGEAARVATSVLIVRTEYARVGPPVPRQIAGRPAVEVAYGTGDETWAGVATFVYAPAGIIAVNCPVDGLQPCVNALAALVVA